MKKAIHSKFHKITAALVAVTILLATLAIAFPAFAETTEGYNGQLFALAEHEKQKDSGYEYTFEGDSTALVPEISGANMTVSGWTADSTTDNKTYVYVATENKSDTDKTYSFTQDNAVMFYVKTAANTPANELFLQLVTSTKGDAAAYGAQQWIYVKTETDVYYLHADNNEWTTLKATTSNVAANRGNIVIPAGFEGWIRIPYDNLKVDTSQSTEIFRLDLYLKCVGGEYTANDISIGNFMFVDNPAENLTTLTIDESKINLTAGAAYNAQKLDLGEFSSNNYYSLTENSGAIVQTAGIFNDESAKNYTLAVGENATDKLYTGDFYTADYANYVCQGGGKVLRGDDSNWGTFSYNNNLPISYSGSRGFDFTASTAFTENKQVKYFNIGLKSDGNSTNSTDEDIVWNAGRSMLFYIETTATKANKFSFIVEGAPSEGTTKIYSRLATDKKYYLLSNGSTSWQEGTTAVAYEGSWGYIEIPAGFKGFVRIPCNAILRNATTQEIGTMYRVQVYPYNLGGDYGTLTIGAFGTVDKTTENLMYISSAATENTPVLMTSGDAYAVTLATPTGSYSNKTTSGYTWDGANATVTAENLNAANMATGTQVYMAVSAAPAASGDSILFYVTNTSASDAIGGVNANIWRCVLKNKTYYMLSDGASDWVTCTSVDSGNGDNNGCITIPAYFNGWVKIPVASFASGLGNTDKQLTQFGFWPMVLNGSLTFSNIMTTTTPAANNYMYADNGKIAALSDIDTWFDKAITSYDVTVADGTITTTAPATALGVSATASAAPALNAGNGIMFYAESDSAVKLDIALSNSNNLNNSFKFYTYAVGGNAWVENTVADGLINLPADFAGWVRVPASAFANAELTALTVAFAQAADITLSDFYVIDDATATLGLLRVDGKKVSLFVEHNDINADGNIDIRDMVRLNKAVNDSEVRVPELACKYDISSDYVAYIRAILLGISQNSISEVALSCYLSEQGYITAANYTGNNTATVDTVNF